MNDLASLQVLIAGLWTAPTPAGLRALQAPLLAMDTPQARAAHDLAGKFYVYLSTLETKLSAKRYSQLAALLQSGAVITIGLDDVLAESGRGKLRELLAAALAGGLEMVAAVQEVKAWAMDTRAADLKAAWELYTALWRLSAEMQPNQPDTERAANLERLLAPLTAPDTPDVARAALAIRLFQIALLARLLAAL